jgi:hypothetical protein
MGGLSRMHISGEGKIGIALTLAFGVGGGAAMMWPSQSWIGFATMVLSSVGLVGLGYVHFCGPDGTITKARIAASRRRAAAAPPIIDLLTEAATYNEPAWETGEGVPGGDLVEWFAEWRIRARKALGLVAPEPLTVSDPEELRIVKAALEAYGDDKDRRSQAYVVAHGVIRRMKDGTR